MLGLVLAVAVGAASGERPTLAIVPPVAIDGAETWLGLAVADNLATGLLRFSKKSGKAKDYPLNVFSWRETTSAARGEALDLGKPLDAPEVARLARQLGARYVFTGSYKVQAGGNVLLKWRLVDTDSAKPPKEHKVKTNLSTIALRTDKLTAAVIRGLGQKPPQKSPPPSYSTKALRAYGKGLEILARQSLDPNARVVIPALELKKARVLFEDAAREAPSFLRAYIGAAVASAMLGELPRAEQDVLRALADADQFEPLNVLGLYYLYVRQEKPQEAIRALAAATTQHPGFLGALGYLGGAHLRYGEPKRALEVFTTYTQRVPKSPWARVMRARAMSYSGEAGAAVDVMLAVQRDFPDSIMVLEALGARLTQAKRYDEALAVLERGIAQHGEQAGLLTRLSYVHLQRGAAEAALSLAQRAVDKSEGFRGEPLAGQAHVNLGHALAILGKKPEALEAFKKAAALGVSVEDKLALLADERAKAVVQDPSNPLVKDAPPPPPPPPPPLEETVVAAAPASAPAAPPPAPAASAPPAAASAQAAASAPPPAASPPAAEPAAPSAVAVDEPASDAEAVAEDEVAWDEGDDWSSSEDWSEEGADAAAEGDAATP